MAYASLVSLEQTTDRILNRDKYSISFDEKEKIISIREYAIFMIPFLENFPQKAYRLEGKIRSLAYEAEDIIENFMWKQFRMSWWIIGVSRGEFGEQLGNVREEIGTIAGELMDDRLVDLPAAAVSSSRFASTGKHDDVVIGLDEDLMAIKERLCGESFKLDVIPIVGMAGIGKTTLARTAYNDQFIVDHFQIRAWVTVSQDYSAKEIFSRVLDYVQSFEKKMEEQKNQTDCARDILPDREDEQKNETYTAQQIEQEIEEQTEECKNGVLIRERLYKSLKGRRYLIVMDDVWSTEILDDIRCIFPDDDNGSRIMLTTRLSNVASYSDSDGPLHEMRFMDEEQSWDLLRQKVFADGNGQHCPPELSDIGKGIARSCKGLPLAVVLVAGILSTITMSPHSWMEIAKSVNSVIDGQLGKILYLSYKHLPHPLRPCFLFLGSFPEDHEIRVSKLVKLWVAEGFLKHQSRYKGSVEDMAEEYLEDLVKRSLVLPTSRKSNGKIKSCSLHDVVRDLCIRTGQEEKFLRHVIDNENIMNERRLSFYWCGDVDNLQCPTIRTIIWSRSGGCSSLVAFVENFRLLRVLDLVNSNLRVLPSQVYDLFHLRYLSLRHPGIISPDISKLENLQTLIFNPGEYQLYLYMPWGIWRMRQLRHLIFPCCYNLPDPPMDGTTLPLEDLQTLSWVTGFVCTEKILRMIPNLKKLGIIYSDNQEYQLHNLIHLQQLEQLKVIMSKDSCWRGKGFAFPRTLKKLTLVGGELPWKYMAVIGSLPNLEVLKLREGAYRGATATWEAADGEFPRLKFLMIEMSDLQQWTISDSCFTRLERLVLHYCWELGEIPSRIGDILTLQLIDVYGCSESLVESAKGIQEDQKSCGNDQLQVRTVLVREFRSANGEFPELKSLMIKKSHLRHWITESSHFARLERLVLHQCRYPDSIPDGLGEIPALELIEVDYYMNRCKRICS